ncbi:MAG: hypothetical protein K8R77_00285 [Anaerolineaceae bacterium]|nr:hypothetical protein [Anaerolineaceae bacterium]
MGTQQAAIWLGRTLSTHDVMIRVTSQLMDIVTVQQHMIDEMQKHVGPLSFEDADIAEQSEKILKELDEIRGKIGPVLKMVNDSCVVLEKMIEG